MYELAPSELDIDDFAVTVSPPGTTPTITGIDSDEGTVTIHFDAYPDRTWTTVTHVPSGTSTRNGWLPADVNADGMSNTSDILSLIDSLTLAIDPLPIRSTDIDRSGIATASDILRLIDLLNGAGSYASYIGQSLPK